MSNFPNINQQYVDGNGEPLASGTLTYYEAGTTTPLATYPTQADADAATNANANPMTLDANGRPPVEVYGTSAAYKVVLKDSAASTVKTWDDKYFTQQLGVGVATRIKQVASNPLDYGAIGDGAADESAEVQLAIDNATGVVDLLGLTFRCDSQIVLTAGLTLRNGALDFSACSDNEYILAAGTRGSFTDLTASAAAADETIDVTSASGLSAGDFVFTRADDDFNGGSDDVGEVSKIASISSLELTLVDPLFDDYTTGNNARTQKLNMVSDIRIQDLVIDCTVGASGDGRAVALTLCEGVYISNVVVNSPKGAGFDLRSCVGANVVACTVNGAAVTGVGYDVGAHSRNVNVSGCLAYLLDIGYRIGLVDTNDGVARMCAVRQSGALGCTTGLYVDVNSEHTALQATATKPAGGTLYTDNGVATAILGVQDLVGGNYSGVVGAGAGTGAGVYGTGGATGPGVHGVGGATSGAGVYGIGMGNGEPGVSGQGDAASNSAGVTGVGGGSGAGVYGASADTSGYGVHGVATHTNARGVYGSSTDSTGVYGTSSKTGGAGVSGSATGSGSGGYGAGVIGSSDTAYGVVADTPNTTAYAPLRIVPHAQPSNGHVGALYVDTSGVLYICTSAGAPGTWIEVGNQT